MAVSDTQYYRVLIWQNWQVAYTQKADVIVGQPNFKSNRQNQIGLFPRSNTLNWCYETCFDQDEIWIADTGNSRLLWFEDIPDRHNAEACNLDRTG